MSTRPLRRVRGALLRSILQRGPAAILGALTLGAAGGLLVFDFSWESRLTDGVAMVLGASGTALLLAALGGRRPDWIDPTQDGHE